MHIERKISVDPLEIVEKLFFSIVGQKDTIDLALQHHNQPDWILYLFKISFAAYMLVTVIILMNLLIAMMSDTYHSIQVQSDTEWKYGLSKLIRNMQKTTAPSPINLLTTWAIYLIQVYKDQWKKINLVTKLRNFINRCGFKRKKLSANNKVMPLSGPGVEFSPLVPNISGSSNSINVRTKIIDVVDWKLVRWKYKLISGEAEKLPRGDSLISAEHILNSHST